MLIETIAENNNSFQEAVGQTNDVAELFNALYQIMFVPAKNPSTVINDRLVELVGNREEAKAQWTAFLEAKQSNG